MPTTGARITPRKWRRQADAGQIRNFRRVLWCALFIGPMFILHGLWCSYRDRSSLQWPKVTGTVMQSEWQYHGGKHSYYNVFISYVYIVNNQRYVGHQVALWNPDWHTGHDAAKAFFTAHPVHSSVDVFYDPRHPQNAVLVPGADEVGNRVGIWCGAIILVLATWAHFRTRKAVAPVPQDAGARASRVEPEKSAGLPHAFATYEPGNKRKLNCFPDKDCLLEVLGHGGQKIQDWQPEDRVIDTAGREYRLVARPGKTCYDYEPTGETWSWEKLLDVAVDDARLIKKDPDALRRRVYDAPVEKKMAVLMKCIDDLPAGPRWVMIGFGLFLVLFFLTVVFVAGAVISWLQKWLSP